MRHPPLMILDDRVRKIERELGELAERLELLEAVHKAEVHDRMTFPRTHKGHHVVGKIPIWGTGRSLIVFRTRSNTYDLDIVDD